MCAFGADVRIWHNVSAFIMFFLPSLLAKAMDPDKLNKDLTNRLMCPVRALIYYLKLKHNVKNKTSSCVWTYGLYNQADGIRVDHT